MKHLELVFATSENKLKTLSLNYANEDLDAGTVQKAMNQISELKMFEKDGIRYFDKPVAARYAENVVDPIFETRM
ncbi:DUF2922 domain-containing protein [Lentilactobacillus laojiaonis]|uniref:DUF2922 domain-containing protein n=1 Tax=Lentilactobacillus laojiaonis TaxID=2883998 RepID=UPI001D0B5F6F|nr:DUF2922 domain-containing protein [Lentilactobacillus laojiaonis]UDM32044.1 DUF2922 domain-containing protein [Lentilactobacillus laojiaonis]